jgi:hypothetical protein
MGLRDEIAAAPHLPMDAEAMVTVRPLAIIAPREVEAMLLAASLSI